MKARCYNKAHDAYKYYGGRGVKVCKEWLDDPGVFIKWALDNGWKRGLEIDKDIKAKELGVDSLLYSPERCQFVTPSINCNTKRGNRIIKFNGKSQTLKQWSDELGISRESISKRIDLLGYGIEKALTKVDQRSARRKPIVQIDTMTGEIINSFEATIIASKKTNISIESISAALRGRNKTAGGFKWEYI